MHLLQYPSYVDMSVAVVDLMDTDRLNIEIGQMLGLAFGHELMETTFIPYFYSGESREHSQGFIGDWSYKINKTLSPERVIQINHELVLSLANRGFVAFVAVLDRGTSIMCCDSSISDGESVSERELYILNHLKIDDSYQFRLHLQKYVS